ncbi:hypothetical protein CR513_29153, partial [Mucuna pruriens]
MRNPTRNVGGGILSHLTKMTWRSLREPLWTLSSVNFLPLQVLTSFDYLVYEKVWMVAYEFIRYALEIKEERRRHVDTWSDLNRDLRSRFVPTFYGFKSMKEYHSDMEVALTRVNVLESNEAIMSRFLHGLSKDI